MDHDDYDHNKKGKQNWSIFTLLRSSVGIGVYIHAYYSNIHFSHLGLHNIKDRIIEIIINTIMHVNGELRGYWAPGSQGFANINSVPSSSPNEESSQL